MVNVEVPGKRFDSIKVEIDGARHRVKCVCCPDCKCKNTHSKESQLEPGYTGKVVIEKPQRFKIKCKKCECTFTYSMNNVNAHDEVKCACCDNMLSHTCSKRVEES